MVDVILLRVSEEYLGIPNSIPETCDGKFWSASILTKLLLLWIICNFCLGSFVPIPIYPELEDYEVEYVVDAIKQSIY